MVHRQGNPPVRTHCCLEHMDSIVVDAIHVEDQTEIQDGIVKLASFSVGPRTGHSQFEAAMQN